jgi:NADPH:quinone reductase-like Zn-dependent oxidoreductase
VKAVVWTRYGPPEALQLREWSMPVPKEDEVLVKVHATTVCAGDCELRGLRLSLGLRTTVRLLMGLTRPRPRVLGQELSGEVAAVGARVTRFQRGDSVFGTTGWRFGAYAEYACLPEGSAGAALARKPVNMTHAEAATVPVGGLEALHFLRRAGDLRGRRVLINGAGGGIGIPAVQLAKQRGAEVIGVDSPAKSELLRSIGADRVIDYTRSDFTEGGETYDVVFDIAGGHAVGDEARAVREGGRLLLANPPPWARIRSYGIPRKARTEVIVGASRHRAEDLDALTELIGAGRIRAVIDRRFRLDQLPEAHRYFESGRSRGRVVIDILGDDR